MLINAWLMYKIAMSTTIGITTIGILSSKNLGPSDVDNLLPMFNFCGCMRTQNLKKMKYVTPKETIKTKNKVHYVKSGQYMTQPKCST